MVDDVLSYPLDAEDEPNRSSSSVISPLMNAKAEGPLYALKEAALTLA